MATAASGGGRPDPGCCRRGRHGAPEIGRKGLLGSAVVGKRVTDLLDLNEVIHAVSESWFQGAGGAAGSKTVLVAEASAFSRGLIRSGLDMAGYRVHGGRQSRRGIRETGAAAVDVVVAALDLPPKGSSALLAAMRRAGVARIPVLALADSAESAQSRPRSAPRVRGLPGEIRPRGHARIGGAAGRGVASGRSASPLVRRGE